MLQQVTEADFRILDELKNQAGPGSRSLIQLALDGTTTAKAKQAGHAKKLTRAPGRVNGDRRSSSTASGILSDMAHYFTAAARLRRGRTRPLRPVSSSSMKRRAASTAQGDPLKDRIQIGPGAGPAFAEGPRQVIGVVSDTHDSGPDREAIPMMDIPLAQMPDLETALNSRVAPLWWSSRTQVDPRATAGCSRSGFRRDELPASSQ